MMIDYIIISLCVLLLIIFIYEVFIRTRKKKIEVIKDDVLLIDNDIVSTIIHQFHNRIIHNSDDIDIIDDEVIEDLKQNIIERIVLDNEPIELIKKETLNSIKDNINSQIQTKNVYPELEEITRTIHLSFQKIVEMYINSIKDQEKEIKLSNKLNSKTIYPICPQKYIDLLEKDSSNLKFTDNLIYIGDILRMNIYVQNKNEFWFLELQKDDTIRYGFTLEQKRKIKNIVAQTKFLSGLKLDDNESSSFKYIKERINND